MFPFWSHVNPNWPAPAIIKYSLAFKAGYQILEPDELLFLDRLLPTPDFFFYFEIAWIGLKFDRIFLVVRI